MFPAHSPGGENVLPFSFPGFFNVSKNAFQGYRGGNHNVLLWSELVSLEL
jgi:hypothetical protein